MNHGIRVFAAVIAALLFIGYAPDSFANNFYEGKT